MSSRNSTLGRPTVRPPPPPLRNTSQIPTNHSDLHTNSLSRPQGIRRTAPPPPPNVPPPPPPPPSQKLIQVQLKLPSQTPNQPIRQQSFTNPGNKTRAPPPPRRHTSISRKSLEARFGHMFKDIILLPGPEPFVGTKKIYPSKNRANG